MLRDNYRLYQLKKFLFNGNPKKDIIFVIGIGSYSSQEEYVETNVDFARNLLQYLPEEKGEYVETRICSYTYYSNSYSLVGDWSSNKKNVNEKLGGIRLKNK